MIKNIVNHRKENNAIEKCDGWIISNNGTRRRKITTKGWSFEVEWNDGTTSWVSLRDIKESHPIETAEYCEFNQLSDEPAMAWWVPFTLKRRNKSFLKLSRNQRKRIRNMALAYLEVLKKP